MPVDYAAVGRRNGPSALILIQERVKAGLRNARAKGKRLGRPKKILDTKRIAALRAKGIGWKRIAAEMGVGVGTIYRVALEGYKIREKVF